MNVYRVVIRFGTWVHKAGRIYCYDRIFSNSGKPTILCVKYYRHIGYVPQDEYDF